MFNTAQNNLKCNLIAGKDRKVVVHSFKSSQAALKSTVIGFIASKFKDQKEPKVVIRELVKKDRALSVLADAPGVELLHVELKEIDQGREVNFLSCAGRSRAPPVLIVDSLELLTWFSDAKASQAFLSQLGQKASAEGPKAVHLFFIADQLASSGLLRSALALSSFWIDWASWEGTPSSVFCSNFPEGAVAMSERVAVQLSDHSLTFSRLVPQNTVIEKRDPDRLIQSTFKMGVSQEQQAQKNKVVLPFFKEKQIKEMKDAEELGRAEVEEETDLGFDDEQDEFDDFDV